MYISKVTIRNFRIFDQVGITASLKKGINAIISENNCGKSAFIDALRIAFSTTSYKKDIYFNLTDFHIDGRGIRCKEAFIDIFLDEVPPDLFEIWNPENTTKGEFHIRYYVVPSIDGREKVKFQTWGGPVEGNSISSETFDTIQLVYLGALRDAENELRPARTGKLSNLFSSVADTSDAKKQIVEAMRNANAEISEQAPVKQIQRIINENLSIIEQDLLKQQIDIRLVEPRFESIAASLRAYLKPRWIYLEKSNPIYETVKDTYTKEEWNFYTEEDSEGVHLDSWFLADKPLAQEIRAALSTELNTMFEITQNGLGYNNLLFMAAVLGDIKSTNVETLYNLLLVEEPEAHLHPQLQELVHCFFEKNSNNDNVQVIYTSHSPTLVSRIGIDRIVLLYDNAHRVNCLSFSESNLDEVDRYYLERYLDVTKSQMLFAIGIVFVEGICDALLLPAFANLLDRSFDKYAVEIVNVDGVAFKPFADLLCYANDTQKQTIKTAIITDDDRCADKFNIEQYVEKEIDFDTAKIANVVEKTEKGTPSVRYIKLQTMCEGAHISIFGARKTLEYELSLNTNNLPYMLGAILDIHPQVGKSLYNKVEQLDRIEEKAAAIWLFMRERSKSKGEVAQALSRRLTKKVVYSKNPDGSFSDDIPASSDFIVPEYIKKAIFTVTKEKAYDGTDR